MAETQTLNFGPEWLRALSGGVGSSIVASPPLSPALPKYKLADYRYGREEMLALYVKDNMIPVDLHDKEFLPILQEEPLPPLALVPFTEEEQVRILPKCQRDGSNFNEKGRGDGGFYQRSFDDVEGGFGHGGREMHRSQSWEERGDRRFEKPGRKDPVRANYEDAGAGNSRKHEFIRSESDNWRMTRDEQNGEDDDGGWRIAGSRRDNERWCPPSPDGPRSAGWREHPDQRRRFPFDSRGEDGGYRRPRSGSGSVEEERDSLPEWCLEDAEEETGTFDSSGAFLSLKVRVLEKAPKEPILEEAELDFRPLEENEECTEKDDSESEQTKDTDTESSRRESDRNEEASKSEEPSPVAVPFPAVVTPPKSVTPAPLPSVHPEPAVESERPLERTTVTEIRPELSKAPLHTTLPNSIVEAVSIPHVTNTLTDLPVPTPSVLPVLSVPTQTQQVKPLEMPVAVAPVLPHSMGIVGSISRPSVLPSDMDEDEGLKHFEQEAEKMVAYLQDGGLDDERLATKIGHKPTALPIGHEAAFKWFYKDPQGEIQGPFNNQEMSEWFQAGYFTMTLQVKRGCDEMFQPLGEMMKLWGRVPFTAGPALPPILGDDQESMKRRQEIVLNMYQLQQLQYQYLLRQQYALAQQKVLSSAPPPQQQQLNLLLHQALKIRTPEPQPSLLPPVTRSMSVPDSGSVWEMQNPSTQASCSPNMQPSTPSTWEGSSVWDLPLDSMPQASSVEQIQMEKAKALKEEALQRQREQEEAQRRKKEEQERLAREEALRQLEERRKEEEERRQREEFLRKHQEEERRKQEELEAQRRLEEEKRLEEEAAAAALERQQQEEQKKREQEAQRQQELQRQRQQQQEALRRLQQQQQQQQLAQMKLPSSSKWGQQSTTANTLSQSHNALSLAEIQKLEEERERQTQEEQRRQQQEFQRTQQQQPQAKLSGWGNVAKQPAATKSLLEIQREEAQQMKQRKEQQQQPQQQQQQQQPQQQQNTTVTQQNRVQNRALNSSVWGSVSNVGSNWMMDSSIWGDAQNSNIGFWDEAVKEAAPPQATRKSHNQKNKGNANLSNSSSGKASKKVEEEEKLLKLFQGANKNQDGFMQWCEQTLHTLNTANNLDVPTFASFLKEVDSPYEVHDYVRAYLGDTPQAKDFAKQFLERRAKQNANQQKPQQGQQQKQQDSVWGLSQVSQSVLQQQRFETVTSGKKKKKQKMVRADPSLLGFSVNASSERLNGRD
uniref:GRB10 interacting GYF protein 2 n=1 Tax=Cyprinus carpio TaxID=7962 RepID=A0A8C1IZT4_CYPCA